MEEVMGRESGGRGPIPSHRHTLYEATLTRHDGDGRVKMKGLKHMTVQFLPDGSLGSVVLAGMDVGQMGSFAVGSRWDLEATHRDVYVGEAVPPLTQRVGPLEVRHAGLASGGFRAISEGYLVLVPPVSGRPRSPYGNKDAEDMVVDQDGVA